MDEVYTPAVVSRLLANYMYIRAFLVSATPRASNDPTIIIKDVNKTKKMSIGEVPLGYNRTDTLPFRGRKNASPTRDGKAKARRNEEWLVSILDIEMVLNRLTEDELKLVHLYFFQGYTAEEVASVFGLSSPQAVSMRAERLVARITRMLNEG